MAKPEPKGPPLDRATVETLLKALEDRIKTVEIYGMGGCPTCHDGEARGFAFTMKRLLDQSGSGQRSGQ